VNISTQIENIDCYFSNEKKLRSSKTRKELRQPVFKITRKTLKLELTLSFGRCVSEETTEVDGWVTNILCAAEITHQPSMRKYSGKPYISSESVLRLFITKQVQSHCLCATECHASLNLFVFSHVQGLKVLLTKFNWVRWKCPLAVKIGTLERRNGLNLQRQHVFLTFEFGLGISLEIRMRATSIFALIWIETRNFLIVGPSSYL